MWYAGVTAWVVISHNSLGIAAPNQEIPVGPDVVETITVPELIVPRISSKEDSKNYSLTQATYITIPAKKAKLPLNVFGEESGAASTYVPSGYMGDSGALKIKSIYMPTAFSSATGRSCLEVKVLPRGRQGWAGLYWQTPANNWGKMKGAGYDLSSAKKLSFWMRGKKGGEKIVEIKIGGLTGPYPDSDSLSIGPLRLTKAWKQYVIDLTGADLRHVAGGFALIVRRSDNPRGAVFYLDEIRFEGDVALVPK